MNELVNEWIQKAEGDEITNVKLEKAIRHSR